MQRPPVLTERERQIVPFLAAGSSRTEMAQHFKVSAETIKIHVRNILNKFDAANFRDGAAAIKEYTEHFGEPEPAYNLFCISVDARATIDLDRKLMTSRVTSRYVGIRDESTSIISTVTHGNFKVISVKLDGVPSVPKESHYNTDIHEKYYDPPIPPGVEFIREFEVIRDLGDQVFERSGYMLSINYPTGDMKVSVEFIGDRVPPAIEAVTLLGAIKRKSDTPNIVKESENTYSMQTSNPKIGVNYSIRWKWEDE